MPSDEQQATERRQRATYVSLVWRVDRVTKAIYLVAVCTCDQEDRYKKTAADLYPDNTIHAEQAPLNHLYGERDLLTTMNRRWKASANVE